MKADIFSTEYDTKFRESTHIKFLPFVGKKYKDLKSKILILGESHYLNPYLEPNEIESYRIESNNDIFSTRNTFIDEYFSELRDDGSHPHQHIRSYRYTAAMITGKEYHNSDYIWEHLSFYNFFQEVIGKNAKDKSFITEELIENSRKALWDVTAILSPDLIIAWGLGSLYSSWVPQDDFELVNGDKYLYKYKHKISPYIWHIPHPSKGFSYENYNKEFMTIIKELNLNIDVLQ